MMTKEEFTALFNNNWTIETHQRYKVGGYVTAFIALNSINNNRIYHDGDIFQIVPNLNDIDVTGVGKTLEAAKADLKIRFKRVYALFLKDLKEDKATIDEILKKGLNES